MIGTNLVVLFSFVACWVEDDMITISQKMNAHFGFAQIPNAKLENEKEETRDMPSHQHT